MRFGIYQKKKKQSSKLIPNGTKVSIISSFVPKFKVDTKFIYTYISN